MIGRTPGLTPPALALLEALYDADEGVPGPIDPHDIADLVGLNPDQVDAAVVELVRHGMIDFAAGEAAVRTRRRPR